MLESETYYLSFIEPVAIDEFEEEIFFQDLRTGDIYYFHSYSPSEDVYNIMPIYKERYQDKPQFQENEMDSVISYTWEEHGYFWRISFVKHPDYQRVNFKAEKNIED